MMTNVDFLMVCSNAYLAVVGHRQFHLEFVQNHSLIQAPSYLKNLHLINNRERVFVIRLRQNLIRQTIEVSEDVFPISGELLKMQVKKVICLT